MPAAVFSATYADWRLVKTRQVVQIVLEVPLHMADQAYKTMGGMPDPATERWFAVAAIKRDGEKPNKRLVTQTAIACNDKQFQQFVKERTRVTQRQLQAVGEGVTFADLAATFVRSECGVDSRADIVVGSEAGAKWDKLWSEFIVWRDSDKYLDAPLTT